MLKEKNVEQSKVSENLIILSGKKGDIVIGNSKDFRPLHIQNGDNFLKQLNNIKNNGPSSLEPELLELLRSNQIIATKDNELKKPPTGTTTCCGRIDEHTLILPLTKTIKKDFYERSIYYILGILKEIDILTIKFHGIDPVLSWDVLENITNLIEAKLAERRPDILLKYHLHSCLDELQPNILKWLKNNDVTFTIFFPMPKGMDETNNAKSNTDKLSDTYIQAYLVTPVVKNNISQLEQIVEHHANLNRTWGVELPVLPSPNHNWDYCIEKDLPDADTYSQALLNIYKARLLEDDLFNPVNELRHRIANGGYSTCCSCLYGNVTAVESDGNIYPCAAALRLKRMCIGNLTKDTEDNLENAHTEFESIKKQSWKSRDGWMWHGLCGLHCPLLVYSMQKRDIGNCEELIEQYFYKPRLELIKQIVWDIVEEKIRPGSKIADLR
jgi:radical SAM protein with 4Fe4S-binding SPASM domain